MNIDVSMIDFSTLLSHTWFIALLSFILTLVCLPLVVVAAFIYDGLAKKYEKTPKILIMLVVTFVMMLIVVTIIEIYIGYTLPQVLSTS